MKSYQTVVVGTDGSETSLRAVNHAAEIAAESDAKLIIATGYHPDPDAPRAADILKDEGYKVRGNAPIYEILHEANLRAKEAGVKDVEERPIRKNPATALVNLAEEVDADLLVVGNVGLDKALGRWLSLPGNVSRRAKTDVLVVNTTGQRGELSQPA
ncbi:MAG: universal stress protein [Actinomycetia bacterium]|nr:universal stress protein [Actinomycetes bacterium]